MLILARALHGQARARCLPSGILDHLQDLLAGCVKCSCDATSPRFARVGLAHPIGLV
jgi:hypothetical protein